MYSHGYYTSHDLMAMGTIGIIILLICFVWEVVYIIQAILGYGTAYRKTKAGGDNGVALFGWLIVYSLAAIIPGLGFYLWSKSKNQPTATAYTQVNVTYGQPVNQNTGTVAGAQPAQPVAGQKICPNCGATSDASAIFCNNCGGQL